MSRTKQLVGTGIGIAVLSQPSIANALFAFVFTGALPFTRIILPFWAMMLLIGTVAAAAIMWLFKQPLFIGDTANSEKIAKSRARSYVLATATNQQKKKSVAAKPVSRRRVRKNYQTATS